MHLALPDLLPSDEFIAEHAGGLTRAHFIAGGGAVVEQVLVGKGGLAPTHRVLDIGCGCGRIARPLARYLAQKGSYDGLDLRREVIDWCREAYRDFPNFHFHCADIGSTRYNPSGTIAAAHYRLPFKSGQFDMVFLGSVFTHMLPEGIDNYLREIARVLKPSGLCLATFFLLDAESAANNAAGLTTPHFAFEYGTQGCRIEVSDIPEAAIAYLIDLVRGFYERNGLVITEIGAGQWGHGSLSPNMQDAVWSRRLFWPRLRRFWQFGFLR